MILCLLQLQSLVISDTYPEHFKAPKSLCDFRAVERLLDETLLPEAEA